MEVFDPTHITADLLLYMLDEGKRLCKIRDWKNFDLLDQELKEIYINAGETARYKFPILDVKLFLEALADSTPTTDKRQMNWLRSYEDIIRSDSGMSKR